MKKPKLRIFPNRVLRHLSNGLGIEHIAIKEQCAPDDVRKQVQVFRAAGVLEKLYKNLKVRAFK